jgi:hypothetical protein
VVDGDLTALSEDADVGVFAQQFEGFDLNLCVATVGEFDELVRNEAL